MKFYVYLILVSFSFFSANAQLGFCSGNSGDPIFTEDFGAGTVNSPLAGGTTTYIYTDAFPNDGFYTVGNGSFGNPFDWHQVEDHTPNDTDGKFLIVNADFSPGEFYRTTVSGLCETTTYEFSAWLLNLIKIPGFCSNQGIEIPFNVRFEIWDSTDTNLLANGETGDVFGAVDPTWGEYGLVFQTLANQDTVILKMINNGQGGCGNDLAIDDIEFKSCGDTVIVTDESNNGSVTICENETPYSTTLTATPDFAVFTSHFYQWQESSDGNIWTDIGGETNQTINITLSSESFYRTKIAEVAINLGNDQCILLSDVFQIEINVSPDAPLSNGDADFNCNLNEAILSVSVPSDITVNWYDALTDGNLLLANSLSYTVTSEGTYYAEAVNNTTGCVSIRTAIRSIILEPDAPISDGDADFDCALSEAVLSVSVPSGIIVNWYDLETGGILLLTNSATYTVNDQGTYYAEAVDDITGCISIARTAVSVSGISGSENCNIPQGISPGVSPGKNDNFDLSNFAVTKLEIYNRYGTLVYSRDDYSDEWEGQTNKGEELPVGTYFYTISYEGGTKSRSGWVYINR